jgi:hypothetical protein
MDAQAALDELTILSRQVVEAVLCSADGRVAASTVADEARAAALARAGQELLAAAAGVRAGGPAVERVHVALDEGSLFLVRDAGRTLVATTVADATPGLVLYDLRTALRRSAEAPARRRRTRSRPEAAETAGGDA